MNLHHLEYFLAVVKEKSFTKAAKKLHVSQPSISKMIKDMERELGIELLYRNGKEVELTDGGKAIFNQVQEIVTSFKGLSVALDDVVNLKRGFIKIGIPPIVSASFFPGVIGKFIETYPEIKIELTETGSKTIENRVDSGELDLGIICSAPHNPDKFIINPFIKDPLKLVVHKDHPLTEKDEVSLLDLQRESFVLFREDFSLHDHIINRCEQLGFSAHVVCRSSQRDFMTEMVARKVGVSLLPKKICEEINHNSIKVLPLAGEPIHLDLTLIWKKNKYLSIAVTEWLKFVSHYFDIPIKWTS